MIFPTPFSLFYYFVKPSINPNLQAGIHPEQPANTVSRAGFEALWRHSVELLQRGFKTGSILTVDLEEAKVLGAPWTRRCDFCRNPNSPPCEESVKLL